MIRPCSWADHTGGGAGAAGPVAGWRQSAEASPIAFPTPSTVPSEVLQATLARMDAEADFVRLIPLPGACPGEGQCGKLSRADYFAFAGDFASL